MRRETGGVPVPFRWKPTPYNGLRFELHHPFSVNLRLFFVLIWSLFFVFNLMSQVDKQNDPEHMGMLMFLDRDDIFDIPVWGFGFGLSTVWTFSVALALVCGLPLAEGLSIARLPQRLLGLPVRSTKIVWAYAVPRLMLAALISSAFGPMLTLLEYPDYLWWVLPCTTVLLTAAVLAWVLAPGDRTWLWGGVGVVGTAVALYWTRSQVRDFFGFYQAWIPLAALIGVPVLLAIAVLGLNHYRHQRGGSSITRIESIAREFPLRRRRRPFRSAREAQRWYEWRRIGWHLPIAQGLMLLVLGIIGFGVDIDQSTWDRMLTDPEYGLSTVSHSLLYLSLLAPWMLNMLSARHLDRTDGAFYFTRPKAHAFLWQARRHALNRNILLGICLYVGYVVVLLLRNTSLDFSSAIASWNLGPFAPSLAAFLFLTGPAVFIAAAYTGSISVGCCLAMPIWALFLTLGFLGVPQYPIALTVVYALTLLCVLVGDGYQLWTTARSERETGVLVTTDLVKFSGVWLVSFVLVCLFLLSFPQLNPSQFFLLKDQRGLVDSVSLVILLAATIGLVAAMSYIQVPERIHRRRHIEDDPVLEQ